MNRTEVIMTIKKVGTEFSRIRAALNTEDFTNGYNAAVFDMVKLFEGAPIDPNFEVEREAMLAHIRVLKEKNAELDREVCEKHATIHKLLDHVNIADVLGVGGGNYEKKEEPKAQRRGVAFIFK